MSVQAKDELRWSFLVAVFEATDGSPEKNVALGEIEVAWDIFDYLSEEGVVDVKFMGGQIGVTHAGRLAVEAAIRESPPSRPVGFRPRGA